MKITRTIGAGAIAALTVTTVLVAPPAHADDRSVAIGNAWLVRQLDGGVVHNDQYDFDDVGLTIDTALALAAVDAPASQLDRVEDGLEGVVDGYTQTDEYDDEGNVVQLGRYAGSSAKALVVAQVLGADPAAFGGADLVARTEALVLGDGPTEGRLADDSSYGDYANVIGQVFGARGLTAAGSPEAAAVVDFLLEQQCTDGYFRQDFAADKTATEQGCVDGTDAPDVDTTALAVLNLMAIDAPSTAVSTAIAEATAWLMEVQAPDGSFSGTGTGAPNSNSTGLAGWALGERGQYVEAARAGAWVRRVQAVDNGRCTSALSGEQGAIALDQAAFDAGLANGIPDEAQDQWRRATTQALPGLVYAPTREGARGLSGGSDDFVAAGSVRSITATGIAPGDRACAWTTSTSSQRPASFDGTVTIPVRLPATSGSHVLTVTDSSGTMGRTTFEVLAARTLGITFRAAQVRQGGVQRITVGGLAAGESVRVTIRGKQVATGTAGQGGSFSVAVRLTKARYAVGSATVRVTGEFANRTGSKAFRVVR